MLAVDTNVAVLRMFRAFRRAIVAFRVVKLLKLDALKIIVMCVMKSLLPVSNAFVLLGIVMGIWSIMGVNFYAELYPDYFGNFSLAMLTMLQIMSFDSWSSGIARPVILNEETPDVQSGIFFIMYVFASAIIMANVVLAILIDKFLTTAKEFADAENAVAEEEKFPPQALCENTEACLNKLQDIAKTSLRDYIGVLKERADMQVCCSGNAQEG
jgi:voltage-gated sodium channel